MMIFTKIVITNFDEKLRKFSLVFFWKIKVMKIFAKSLETSRFWNIKVALFKIRKYDRWIEYLERNFSIKLIYGDKNFLERFWSQKICVCLRNIAFIVAAIISAIIFDNISQILTGTVCYFSLTLRQIGFVFSRPN